MTKKEEPSKPPPCRTCKGTGYVETDTKYVHTNGQEYGNMTKPCPVCRGQRPAAVPPTIDQAKRAAGDTE